MNKSTVYYSPFSSNEPQEVSKTARQLVEKIVEKESIHFTENLPIKIHSGEQGNDTFIKPINFDGVIDYLEERNVSSFFTETNVAYGGPRSEEASHMALAKDHGFTRIPFVVADGDGHDSTEVPITGGKHFKSCKIAQKLASQDQALVMVHFKGHCMAGFGGAIKMLGIGFASARGKAEIHSAKKLGETEMVDWAHWKNEDKSFNTNAVYANISLWERIAEYALAASQKKNYIYVVFAMNITPDCDCEGHHMDFMYKDLGLFASLDPVAVDSVVMDMLTEREGKVPFLGNEILAYAEKIGMGNRKYTLERLEK